MLSFTNIKKNNKEIFGIHGGGNIGLGLMADIASKSPFNYRIVATSNDKFLQKIVNSVHQLWLQHTASSKMTHIKNVTIVPRNFTDIVKLYKESSILAICLTPAAMKSSAKAIAQGLIERHRLKQKNLKILVLMNLPDCGEVVRETVTQEINLLLNDSAEAKKVCDNAKFITTVSDRIVTKISEEEIKDQLKRHILLCTSMDFIDQKWLNHQVTCMLNSPEKLATGINKFNLKVSLFNAEKNFALYAPSQIQEVSQFPAIKAVNDLKQIEAIKNKYINGPHAIMAWLGSLFGCKTIADAIKYPGMKEFIEKMIDEEITPVLMAEYSQISKDELVFFKQLFLERCEQSIDDPVERVGRDPLRKINSGERVRGTLELQKQHNLNNSISGLTYGIAAAVVYAVKQLEPSDPDCKKIQEIYCKRKSYKDVLCYNGTYSSGIFVGLNKNLDIALTTKILSNIMALERMLEMQKTSKQPLSLSQMSEFAGMQAVNLATFETKSPSYADVAKDEVVTFLSYCRNRFMKCSSNKIPREVPIEIQPSKSSFGR